MSINSFNRQRREFLSNSTKAVAGISIAGAFAGSASVAGRWVFAESRPMTSQWRTHASVPLLTAGVGELGSQLFADVPTPLRPAILQTQSVLNGIKPACRLSLSTSELGSSLAYLKNLELAFVVEQTPVRESSYAQVSLDRRRALNAQKRVRVYLAKSANTARHVADLERDPIDYRGLGLALGYPECCVAAAAQHDQAYVDQRNQVWRQSNLNASTVRSSTAADFRCNQFLVESELHDAGPLAAIAHYPCKLDCPRTIELAQTTLELSARIYPMWTITLSELLRAPVVFWSDESWPSQYWDEYCGLALVEAQRSANGDWRSPLPGIRLGAVRTAAGDLPRSVSNIVVLDGQVLLQDTQGHTVSHPLASSGRPWVIDWRAGQVQKLI